MSGVPITVNALPTVTPTTGDSVPVWDTETGVQGRVTMSGLGALFAMLSGAAFSGAVIMNQFDAGSPTGPGPVIRIQRNTNATNPSPGFLNLVRPDASNGSIYVTDDGLLRILSSFNVHNGNMASGTIVGTQSSNLAEKDVLPDLADIEEVLAAVAEGAAAVRRFMYKPPMNWDTGEREGTRPMNGQVFEGVIIDYSERYGMDRDEAHPEGRSLNTINATGDLLRAVDWLVQRNADLESRLAALEGGAGGG